MHDPRTPEILAWVDTMPIAERLTVMDAMSFAFPILKNDQDWTARVSAMLVELRPTKREHEDMLIEAARMSRRLSANWQGSDETYQVVGPASRNQPRPDPGGDQSKGIAAPLSLSRFRPAGRSVHTL